MSDRKYRTFPAKVRDILGMSDRNNFHEIALKSGLFKGRPDLYFCYLKAEKIAHGIARLFPSEEFSGSAALPERLLHSSGYLPETVVRYAAHEIEEEGVLVDLFELLSLLRLAVSQGFLEEQNGLVLVDEYQSLVEKIMLGRQVSPFLSLEDFEVSPFPAGRQLPVPIGQKDVKDSNGTRNGRKRENDKGQNPRGQIILKILVEKGKCSIKDISNLVRNCSEKTIQRELSILIRQGLVRKEGERRWSVYMPQG